MNSLVVNAVVTENIAQECLTFSEWGATNKDMKVVRGTVSLRWRPTALVIFKLFYSKFL